MPNTYTNLVSDFYDALDVVSRELSGCILASGRDSTADRCALNANAARNPVVPVSAAAADVTPAMSLPSESNQTITNKGVQITKSRYVPFSWTGEDELALNSSGTFLTIQQNSIAQAIRTLVNEMETDLCTEAYQAASRAHGTAGTTPFATGAALTDIPQTRKILVDNGAPQSDLHLIVDTSAGVNLRSHTNLTKANEAGTDDVLRQGSLLDLQGMMIRESAQVLTPTKGTGSGYLVDLVAGYSVGDTTVHVDTGTGTILAGDVVTFTGDTNKYVVTTGFAGDGDGDIVLAEPGLRQTLANNVGVTIGDTATQNVAFHRQALQFATRLPALPSDGDIATFREVIVDDRTGLAFELAAYPGYRMNTYQVLAAWGKKAIKPEHMANLLG